MTLGYFNMQCRIILFVHQRPLTGLKQCGKGLMYAFTVLWHWIRNLPFTHYWIFSAIDDFDAVSFRDITTDSDIISKTAVFEVDLGPLTGLDEYLTYDATLSWSQVGGNQSGTIHASYASVGFYYRPIRKDYNASMERVSQNSTTYRIYVPIRDLGEGRLLVSMTINLYCISYINIVGRSFGCNCSQWQVGWVSNSLEISAKRG